MKSIRSKLTLALILALGVLQFSFAMMMTHAGHESFCAFDEHCVLQTVMNRTEATQPLLPLALPAFLILFVGSILIPKQLGLLSSSTQDIVLKGLKGIVKKE